MSIITSFFNSLNKRITDVYSQKDNFNNQKNAILEIENILLDYGIQKNNLNENNIILIDAAKFRKIMELINENDIDYKVGLFISSVAIIKIYNESNASLLRAADQVESAKKYLSSVANYILNYIQNYVNTNDERIKSLLSTIKLPEEILNKFSNGILIEPLIYSADLEGLNNLLSLCGFNEVEKATFLYEIGKENYKLFFPKKKTKTEQLIIPETNKFKILLANKIEKYYKVMELLNQETIAFPIDEKTLSNLSLKYKNPVDDIRNALVGILLQRLLDKFSIVLVQDDNHTIEDQKELDNIFQTLTKVKDYDDKYSRENPDLNVIEIVESIIRNEEMLISSINHEELNTYLANNFEVEVKDQKRLLQYEIAAVVLALKGNLDELNAIIKLSTDENIINEKSRNQKIGEISELIKAYHLLKEKFVKLHLNNQNPLNKKL